MQKYELYLFDMDGTLTDSAEGIFNSVAYALGQMQLPVPPHNVLMQFLGPPLIESFQQFCALSPAQAEQAIVLYRTYFTQRGMWENQVYPGIESVLQALQCQGCRLAVATSKPEAFAKQILERFGLAGYFEYIAGASMDNTHSAKADVIRRVLCALQVPPQRALMVGDRKHDVLGAAACGVDCVGVLYGYGSKTELLEAGAKYLTPTTQALQALLCGTTENA